VKPPETVSVQSLRTELDREWYHTIDLAPGIVTPGWFDTRPIAGQLPLPHSLSGMRCLDVATFDGFWAFEMERRGADEVVAIDILDPEGWDWPVNSTDDVIAALERRKEGGRGFRVASAALGSSAQFRELSVYDLDRAIVGEFDFVYVGSLLMHLRDPVRALERVGAVCRGRLLLVDNINLGLSLLAPRRPIAALDGLGRPWWWKLNLAGLVRVVKSAGFRIVQPPQRIYMPPGAGHPRPRPSLELLRSEEARHFMLTRLKGDPHAALLAEPVRLD
jgi:tRNA (mo5U34)-methyltransferase